MNMIMKDFKILSEINQNLILLSVQMGSGSGAGFSFGGRLIFSYVWVP
jgi:hypothetical protein